MPFILDRRLNGKAQLVHIDVQKRAYTTLYGTVLAAVYLLQNPCIVHICSSFQSIPHHIQHQEDFSNRKYLQPTLPPSIATGFCSPLH